jgi:hypothetical protein
VSRYSAHECYEVQEHIRLQMIRDGKTSPVLSRRFREFMDAHNRRWCVKFDVHQPKIRLGEFDGTNTTGSMYQIKCRSCGLSGEISFPEAEVTRRGKCPRCANVPHSQWQERGQAGLLPPEKLVPKHQSATINGIDVPYVTPTEDGEGVVEVSSDDTSELNVAEIVAEVDASLISDEIEGVCSEPPVEGDDAD